MKNINYEENHKDFAALEKQFVEQSEEVVKKIIQEFLDEVAKNPEEGVEYLIPPNIKYMTINEHLESLGFEVDFDSNGWEGDVCAEYSNEDVLKFTLETTMAYASSRSRLTYEP